MARGYGKAASELGRKNANEASKASSPEASIRELNIDFGNRLDKAAGLIKTYPTQQEMEKKNALIIAAREADEAVKAVKSILGQWEGFSTGNPNDNATVAYTSLISRYDEIRNAVKEMKKDAIYLEYWFHPNEKTRAEHKDDMEWEGKDLGDLRNAYNSSSSQVVAILRRIERIAQQFTP